MTIFLSVPPRVEMKSSWMSSGLLSCGSVREKTTKAMRRCVQEGSLSSQHHIIRAQSLIVQVIFYIVLENDFPVSSHYASSSNSQSVKSETRRKIPGLWLAWFIRELVPLSSSLHFRWKWVNNFTSINFQLCIP